MPPGTITAARHPQLPATSPVIAPANDAPKHQVARLMPITRPRRCAGQVSATSIDPSDHSPLSANVRSARCDEYSKAWRQRDNRHHQRKHRDVDGKQGATPDAVGEPWPEIEPGNAESKPDLEAGAVGRDIECELLDDQGREITPSMPSTPHPRPLVSAMCQCVRVTFEPSATAR
jgi:hypothetical protein